MRTKNLLFGALCLTFCSLFSPQKANAQWWNQLFFNYSDPDYFPTASAVSFGPTSTTWGLYKAYQGTYSTGIPANYPNPWPDPSGGSTTNGGFSLRLYTPELEADIHRALYPADDTHYLFLSIGMVMGENCYQVIPKNSDAWNITAQGEKHRTAWDILNALSSLIADPIHAGTGGQTIAIPVNILNGELNIPFVYTGQTKQKNWVHEWTPKFTLSGTNGGTYTVAGATTYMIQETWSGSGPKRWIPETWQKGAMTGYIEEVLTGTTVSGYTYFPGGPERWNFGSTGSVTSYEDAGRKANITLNGGGALQRITDQSTGNYLSISNTGWVADQTNTRIANIYNPSGILNSIILTNGGTLTVTNSGYQQMAMADPSSQTIFSNTYTPLGSRIATQVDGAGKVWNFDYENVISGTTVLLKTEETRPRGFVWTFHHDEDLLLRKKESPLGYTSTFDYNADGLLVSATNARGYTTSYQYNAYRLPTKFTDEAGKEWDTEYNGTLNISALEDPLGNRQEFTWSGSNTLTSYQDELGYVWSHSYNSNGQHTKTVFTNTTTEEITYTSGKPTSFKDRANYVWTTSFNTAGFPWKVKNPNNNTTEFTYDGMGRVTKVKTPLGYQTETTYNWAGNITAIKDAYSNTTSFTYDGNQKLLSTTNRLGNTFSLTRDDDGNIATATDPEGRVVSYGYDNDDNLTSVTTGTGAGAETWSYTLDENGNTIAITRPDSTTEATFTFDSRDLLTQKKDTDNYEWNYTYDDAGRLSTVEDPLTNTWSSTYNARSELLSVASPLSLSASQTFNWEGNIDSRTDARSKTTNYSFDTSGRLSGWTTPLGRTWTLGYNSRGLLQFSKNPKNQSVGLTYNNDGLLTGAADAAGNITYGRNNLGQITTITSVLSGTNTSSYSYDNEGQVTGYTGENSYTVGYTYTTAGKLATLTYGGKTVTYGYDDKGRMSTVTDWNSRTTTYTYDANGRLATTTLPNGTVETRTYNTRGLLESIEHTTSGTGSSLWKQDIVYDDARRITGETITSTSGTQARIYGYDALSRLTSGTNTAVGTYSVTYDAATNITATSISGTSTSFAVNDDNEVTSSASTLTLRDLNGNLTYGPRPNGPAGTSFIAYTYDARDRLTACDTTSYTYDAENRRKTRTESGALTTEYVYEPLSNSTLIKINPDGSRSLYVHGLGLAYSVELDNSGTETGQTYYHFDSRGSTVVTTDATVTVTGACEYGPYGEPVGSTLTTQFGYCGRWGVQTDPNGLLFMQSRYFHPLLKRFLTKDFIPGGIENHLSLNLYSYCQGDPIGLIDPMGTDPFGKILAFSPAYQIGKGIYEDYQSNLEFFDGDHYNAANATFNPAYIAWNGFYEANWRIGISPNNLGRPLTKFEGMCALIRCGTAGAATIGIGTAAPSALRTAYARIPAYMRAETGSIVNPLAKRTSYLYQKLDANGKHLKFGIASNPTTRYTNAELNGGKLKIIAQGERSQMLELERNLHKTLPLGSEEKQAIYISIQKAKGYKTPPY